MRAVLAATCSLLFQRDTTVKRQATTASVEPSARLIRIDQVTDLVGIRKESLYRLVRLGKFPRPVKLSERSSAWRESEVLAWINSRPESPCKAAA